ncbi:MAG TPA: hypothetical protein VEZ70_12180 [Allosphingosinicella sp.]|nr:hypothetical protein [Allosphingosinicella sp.]
MTINPKPGNQPDPDDMSGAPDIDVEAGKSATHHLTLEQEEEAARLGDFA